MARAVVVGGGIIGLTVARELRAGGMDVSLLDRDQPGKQASWASAGIVTTKIPRGWAPATLLSNLSVSLWPRLADELRAETGMDIEYRENGTLIPAFSPDEADQLRREIAPLRQAGVEAELVEGAAGGGGGPGGGGGRAGGWLVGGGGAGGGPADSGRASARADPGAGEHRP